MRLLTYDREGARRLGALVDGVVVDLPDAVGHPAYPRTMEALVARHGGTTLDAARTAVSDPRNVREFTVRRARVLAPFLPPFRKELVLGPGDEIPWPEHETYLIHDPQLACILGNGGYRISRRRAGSTIFGFTLMVAWVPEGRRRRTAALSFGPVVVTPDEFDPAASPLVSRIDGHVRVEVDLTAAAWTFPEMIVAGSTTRKGIRPGVVLASPLTGRRAGVGIPLAPGSRVEVEVEGIGVLGASLGAASGSGEPDGAAVEL
jgi:2-keto-4-pentenoate hydratase/2-oxohepta-3-ene-1,7-dioic acid hydratase in catechol pathway